MITKKSLDFIWRNFLFWLSRILNYPLTAPDMLQLCFTFKCNLRCRMCNMHEKSDELKKSGKPFELSFSLMKDLISQAHDMKIKSVIFVGGEPFIEERIFDLIKYSSQLGMGTIVSTNGVLLNKDKIDKIIDAGLSCITFSIDGPDKETYGKIRGSNAFDKAVDNLKNMVLKRNERNLHAPHISILCTVMKQNIGKLAEMVEFAKKNGVDSISFQPVVPDNTDQNRDVLSDTWVDPEMYNILDESVDNLIKLKNNEGASYIACSFEHLRLMKLYFRRKMPKTRKCYFGFNRLLVTQDHKVYFCVPDQLTGRISFGNVSKIPLRELWKSKEAMDFRKSIKKCKRPCLLLCSYRFEFDEIINKFHKFIRQGAHKERYSAE